MAPFNLSLAAMNSPGHNTKGQVSNACPMYSILLRHSDNGTAQRNMDFEMPKEERQIKTLISPGELPLWVPGKIMCASDDLGWKGSLSGPTGM